MKLIGTYLSPTQAGRSGPDLSRFAISSMSLTAPGSSRSRAGTIPWPSTFARAHDARFLIDSTAILDYLMN